MCILREKCIYCVYTAWKVSTFGVILVLIFSRSDWIRGDTPYLSVFSPNAGKCGKNADQNSSEYGVFLYSDNVVFAWMLQHFRYYADHSITEFFWRAAQVLNCQQHSFRIMVYCFAMSLLLRLKLNVWKF